MSELNETHDTEAGVVADLAVAGGGITPLDVETSPVVSGIIPRGGTAFIAVTEAYRPAPDRKRGTVVTFTAESFSALVDKHAGNGTEIYGDERTGSLVAVINDHGAAVTGWGDHRIELQLRETNEWKRWMARNGTIGTQVDFAEHIEDSTLDIVAPPAADLLELAQTFQATVKVNFKQANHLANGERQLQYEETIDSKAGKTGQIVIPNDFEIGISPYEGTDKYRIKARLRTRIADGALRIGYVLDQPELVLREVFAHVLAEIASETGRPVVRGTAARPVTPLVATR